jgi:threonine synthase
MLPRLYCSRCRSSAPLEHPGWRCVCGGLFDLETAAEFPKDAILSRPFTLWRYREALPLPPETPVVTLGEAVTPLVEWPSLPGARLKLEYLCPSGSFKDRGAAILLTHLARMGVRSVVEDSSGNAGAAVAAYAARAGIACRIFVPASTSPGKLTQIAAYGATVMPIPGNREAVATAARAAAERSWYASHVFNPYFFHGTKTFAFEVWEQLGFRAPESVILPVGHGTLLLGAYLGFSDLLRAGAIARLPRLIGVQAERCNPLAAAWRGQEPAPPQDTLAEGIRIAAPDRAPAILEACRKSGGELVSVSEAEIAAALRTLCRGGWYVEPTAAAAPAAALQLRSSGRLSPDGISVIPLTGSGLKAGTTIATVLAG